MLLDNPIHIPPSSEYRDLNLSENRMHLSLITYQKLSYEIHICESTKVTVQSAYLQKFSLKRKKKDSLLVQHLPA